MLRPVLIALLVPVALLGLIVAGRVRFLEGSLVRGDAERMQELSARVGESARVRSRWLGWIGLSVLPGTVLLVALLANGRRRSRMPH